MTIFDELFWSTLVVWKSGTWAVRACFLNDWKSVTLGFAFSYRVQSVASVLCRWAQWQITLFRLRVEVFFNALLMHLSKMLFDTSYVAILSDQVTGSLTLSILALATLLCIANFAAYDPCCVLTLVTLAALVFGVGHFASFPNYTGPSLSRQGCAGHSPDHGGSGSTRSSGIATFTEWHIARNRSHSEDLWIRVVSEGWHPPPAPPGMLSEVRNDYMDRIRAVAIMKTKSHFYLHLVRWRTPRFGKFKNDFSITVSDESEIRMFHKFLDVKSWSSQTTRLPVLSWPTLVFKILLI